MTFKDSTSRTTVAEPSSDSFGISIHEADELGDIKGTELLVEPNQDASRTAVDQRNGDSGILHAKPSQILLLPPRSQPFEESFILLQKWEGYVLEVGQETFLARLIKIEGQESDQLAEIFLEEVDPVDRELVEPGSVFYWSIGYLRRRSGTHFRSSILRFQRLPKWTERKLKAAEERARRLGDLFDDE